MTNVSDPVVWKISIQMVIGTAIDSRDIMEVWVTNMINF